MYRPKGWKNPYPAMIRGGREYGDARVWEDGADTMLEALEAEGKDVEGLMITYATVTLSMIDAKQGVIAVGAPPVKGTLIFIPDNT